VPRSGTPRDDISSFFGFPERPQRWQQLLPYALLLSVTIALYGQSLYFSFEWDDHLYIEQNFWIRQLSFRHLEAIWTGTFLGHYAPVTLSSLAVLYHFFSLEPFGYHLAQLLLHTVCVCLLFSTLKELESPRVALLACLLFAVHPVNIETVAWIAEIKSTLAFLFFLFALRAFLRLRSFQRPSDGLACGLFLLLSLLSKINTVVAPAVFVLYDYRQRVPFNRKNLAILASFFLIAVLFVLIHMSSFFFSSNSLARESLGGAYYGGLGVHLQNIPFYIWFYIRMTFFPYPLTAWHMFLVHERFDWMVAGAWVVLAGAGWLVLRRSRNTQFWIMWFVVFLAPVLQIVPNLTWVAERYLYIPAIGAFVLAGKLFFDVLDRIQPLALRWSWEAAMACVLLVLGWCSGTYLPVFQNNLTLWEATAKTCPTSAICHAGLGSALLEDGQIERGMSELIQAVQIRPVPENLERLGDAYSNFARDYRQAIIAYDMAIEQASGPSARGSSELYAKLARVHLMAGNRELASEALQAGREADPLDPYVLVTESFYQSTRGDRERSLQSLRTALAVTGHVPTAETSGVPRFLYAYWGNAADVGRLLAFLSLEPGPTAAN
jgi:tetratricopeptide (TPR) repeat protein